MLQQFVPLSDISQGSVATHLRCGGIFSNSIIDSDIETISKIGSYMIKLQHTKNCAKFIGPPRTKDATVNNNHNHSQNNKIAEQNLRTGCITWAVVTAQSPGGANILPN